MKRVLIIGAKGMLGQALVEIFKKDRDYKVTSWDIGEIDITRKSEVMSKISGLRPEIILNAAAYNAVDLCESDKKEYLKAEKLNGKAPGYLAEASKKIGSVIVHYSTNYVFSGTPEFSEPEGCTGSCASCSLRHFFPMGFDENANPGPLQKYGKTKLMGEKAVQKFTDRHYIIRLSRLFGKPAKAKNAKKSFFETMLELAKNKKELDIVDGEISNFTYAPDLAKKTREILEKEMPFGTYHIVNSGECSWYDAAVSFFRLAKIKIKLNPVEELKRPAARPGFATLINSKTKPLRNYKSALKDYLKEIRKK